MQTGKSFSGTEPGDHVSGTVVDQSDGGVPPSETLASTATEGADVTEGSCLPTQGLWPSVVVCALLRQSRGLHQQGLG